MPASRESWAEAEPLPPPGRVVKPTLRSLTSGWTRMPWTSIAWCCSVAVAPSSSATSAGRVVTSTSSPAVFCTPVTATRAPRGAAGVGGLAISWPVRTVSGAADADAEAVASGPCGAPVVREGAGVFPVLAGVPVLPGFLACPGFPVRRVAWPLAGS
ncbi:hypothetical protein ACFQ1I_30480 [Kitasatospora arboriphila]